MNMLLTFRLPSFDIFIHNYTHSFMNRRMWRARAVVDVCLHAVFARDAMPMPSCGVCPSVGHVRPGFF